MVGFWADSEGRAEDTLEVKDMGQSNWFMGLIGTRDAGEGTSLGRVSSWIHSNVG
jgi:hypothetical protein